MISGAASDEDDAAKRIAKAISDRDLDFSEPREGKINVDACSRSIRWKASLWPL